MLTLTTSTLELRGIETKVSQKTNKAYYVLFVEETSSIRQYRFVCKDFKVIPQGLNKGDLIRLTLAYNNFKEFDVLGVERDA